MLLFDEKQKGNRMAYKERNLYITYIGKERKRVKSGQNRHKKRETKNSLPQCPEKVRFLRFAFFAFFGGFRFRCFACNLLINIL